MISQENLNLSREIVQYQTKELMEKIKQKYMPRWDELMEKYEKVKSNRKESRMVGILIYLIVIGETPIARKLLF